MSHTYRLCYLYAMKSNHVFTSRALHTKRLLGLILILAITLGGFPPLIASASNNDTEPISLTNEEHEYLNGRAVRMVYDPAWPPYDFRDETGHHSGLAADFLHLISDKSGLGIEPVHTYSWDESMELIRQGEYDMVSLINITESRKSFMDFTSPLLVEPLVLVGNTSSSTIGLKSLKGRLALVRGYVVEDMVRGDYPDIRVVSASSTEDTLRMINEGEAEATIMTAVEAHHLIMKHQWEKLTIINETPYSYRLGIGVRKGNDLLLNILQKSVDGITADEREKVLSKWVNNTTMTNDAVANRWKWIAGGILALLLGLLVYRKCVSTGTCPPPQS